MLRRSLHVPLQHSCLRSVQVLPMLLLLRPLQVIHLFVQAVESLWQAGPLEMWAVQVEAEPQEQARVQWQAKVRER